MDSSRPTALIRFFVAKNLVEAHLVHGVLQGSGVHSVLQREHLLSLGGAVPFTETYVEVWIPRGQVEEACEVLGVHTPNAPIGALSLADTSLEIGGLSELDSVGALSVEPARPETCPSCGETTEPDFDVCWSCGEPYPA